ncbi:MAG TPA: pitrilysin family protein [Gemmatimonadales bacterium]|nr:pitrilysin family protein [Gemmatimonadales bacterium]
MRPRMRYPLALLLSLAAPALAGQALKRDVPPAPGPAPAIHLPSWTRTRLANGAELVVTQKRDLPLVAFSLNFVGGAYNYEPADKLGTAQFTAQMLSEGTTSKTADQLSEAQQLLGTSIFAAVGGEAGSIGFTALRDKFEPALALLADMLLHPAFPAAALERIRGRTLVQLQQSRDQPNTIAANVFARTLYGEQHPYGRVITEATVRAITRDDIVAFHSSYFQPGRAVITVTGDVDPAAAKAAVERALDAWTGSGARPSWQYPAPPAAHTITIYLVDKPKAAQSVFAIGLPGPPRDTPDYYAIQVMNNLLGGLFQSRLNHNIREVKGYSYGVSSSFAFGRGPGAVRAGGGIVTAKTDSALIEFMKEFRGVLGEAPFSDDEITQSKENLIQSLPRRFSSVNGIGAAVATIYTQDLPESFYREYPAKINAITRDDLLLVAKRYLDLDHLNIVIVGDRAAIAGPLAATKVAPLVFLDVEGKPAGPVP